MRDHHLVEYELQVLLELANRRAPMPQSITRGHAIETLYSFGFIRLDHSLTPEGVEVVDSISPPKTASR